MKRLKVTIRTEVDGSDCTDYVELPDEATEKEIEEECREAAMNMIEWYYEEIQN